MGYNLKDIKKNFFLFLPALILILLYFVIPKPEALSQEAWKALFVFFIVVYLWVSEVFHLAASTLIGIMLLFLTGAVSPGVALSGFGSSALFLIIVGFGIATGLVASGLDKRIANEILKLCHTEKTVLLGTMIITAGLSMIMANTTTVIMMIPIMRHMVARTNLNRIALFLAIAFSANIGGVGFLIGTPPNIIAAEVIGWGFNQWLVVAFPFMIAMLALLYLSFLIEFKPRNKLISVHTYEKLGEVSAREKKAAAIIILTLALWLTSSWHPLSTVTVGLIGTALMFIFVYGWDFFERHTDWGVVILIGGAVSIGNALSETGAAQWIANSFLSITGISHPLWVIFGFVALTLTVTQFIQNTATAAIFAPILFSMAPKLGIDPAALIVPMAIGVSMTFLFPPGTAPNALVYSETKIKTKDMFKAGLLPTAFALVALFVLSWLITLYF